MKKIISTAFAAVAALSLAGCSKKVYKIIVWRMIYLLYLFWL